MDFLFENFVDDRDAVPDDAILYRRVDWDRIGGRQAHPVGEVAALSGNCFTDYPAPVAARHGYPGPCMSVGLAGSLAELGVGPEAMIAAHPGYGVASVRAGALRGLVRINGDPCPQGLMHVPNDEEPWHAIVYDLNHRPRKKPVCAAIAGAAEWVIPLVNLG